MKTFFLKLWRFVCFLLAVPFLVIAVLLLIAAASTCAILLILAASVLVGGCGLLVFPLLTGLCIWSRSGDLYKAYCEARDEDDEFVDQAEEILCR